MMLTRKRCSFKTGHPGKTKCEKFENLIDKSVILIYEINLIHQSVPNGFTSILCPESIPDGWSIMNYFQIGRRPSDDDSF